MSDRRRRPPFLALFLFLLLGAGFWLRTEPKPPTPVAEPELAPTLAPTRDPDRAPPIPPLIETTLLPPPSKTEGVEFHGRLVDARSTPLPFVRVESFAIDPLGVLSRSSAETDAEGGFMLMPPPWARLTLTAKAPGHARGFSTLQATDRPSPTFTLQLRTPYAVSGVVVLSDGVPLAGATLRFHPISTRYLTGQETIALNVLAGKIPPEAAWDERCRRDLFLTDEETISGPTGEFKAHSLIGGIDYLVEVVRQGQAQILVDLYTRGLKDGFTLRIPR